VDNISTFHAEPDGSPHVVFVVPPGAPETPSPEPRKLIASFMAAIAPTLDDALMASALAQAIAETWLEARDRANQAQEALVVSLMGSHDNPGDIAGVVVTESRYRQIVSGEHGMAPFPVPGVEAFGVN
jgi:hypothetical protein